MFDLDENLFASQESSIKISAMKDTLTKHDMLHVKMCPLSQQKMFLILQKSLSKRFPMATLPY